MDRTGGSANDIARQVTVAEEKLTSVKERVIEMEKLLIVSRPIESGLMSRCFKKAYRLVTVSGPRNERMQPLVATLHSSVQWPSETWTPESSSTTA